MIFKTSAAQVLKRCGHVCLLKMDVEGQEQEVLTTTPRSLLPPCLVFEYHLTRGHGKEEWAEVSRRLREAGYRIFVRKQNLLLNIDPTIFAYRSLTRKEAACKACERRMELCKELAHTKTVKKRPDFATGVKSK